MILSLRLRSVLILAHTYTVCSCTHYYNTTYIYRDRFRLLKGRKTGAEKMKKSISSTTGEPSESPLLVSCSLPPNVVHSIRGGAGRSRDPMKGLSQSNRELGRNEDGTSVCKLVLIQEPQNYILSFIAIL